MIRELADLEHYLDLANKATLHGLPGETKAENLAGMSRLLSKLATLDANVITSFESSGEQRVQGHASSIGWLQHNTATTGTTPPAGGVWHCGCGTIPWPSRRCRRDGSAPATSMCWTTPAAPSATTCTGTTRRSWWTMPAGGGSRTSRWPSPISSTATGRVT